MDTLLKTVITILQTTPARWTALTAALPQELLTRPAAPGEWSAAECLQHLVDTESKVFPVRVEAFLAGRDFPAFSPDSEGSPPGQKTPAALAAEFAALRSAALLRLGQLAPADLDRRAIHAELGPVSLEEMLNEWAAHDLMHTVQAERALMQPFIQGCGPWLPYFEDHVARK